MSKECCATESHTHNVESHNSHDGHSHEHGSNSSMWTMFGPATISFILLSIGIICDYVLKPEWFSGGLRLLFYVIAYIPVGFPVLKDSYKSIIHGDFFSEFLLMGIATIGAFAIGEYPEGVAVMLFYAVGEGFQSLAVRKAKGNIKDLLDQRPDSVSVLRNNVPVTVAAEDVNIGDIVQLKPGEQLALDGLLISDKASFNTSALTGESKPATITSGESVLAGMINLTTVSQVKVGTAYKDSKLSKILDLVQNAQSQKAPTEIFIRKFAKIYTPIVVALAVAITLLPYFFVAEYHFRDWLYRALIFLVISCPCALVVSIPLGYFGGIGAGSRNGILFKGGNFLDILAKVNHVVLDKTGTLTEGVFKVQKIHVEPGFDEQQILLHLNALESQSTHPIATAIKEYAGNVDHSLQIREFSEIPGHGLKASIQGKVLVAGNFRLLDKLNISYDFDADSIADTIIAIAQDGKFAGYIIISDEIKPGAKNSIHQLHKLGIKTTMLSGDKSAVVKNVVGALGIDSSHGDLLPEDKVEKLQNIRNTGAKVAFVGDGVNDAPVVAISDVGIAMGGLGSDATIETADVVIQNDEPSKIPMAIRIGKETKKIVWQNIALAFGVKAIVMILGGFGVATMWEAVFADVGVALLAILNAVRIQNMRFT